MKKEMMISSLEAEESLVLKQNYEEKDASDKLFEDIEKRNQNTKCYRMKDGTFMTEVFAFPIHHLEEKTGKYKSIPRFLEEYEEEYEAKTGAFHVRFPKKSGAKKYVRVEKNGFSLVWRYLPVSVNHGKRAIAFVAENEENQSTNTFPLIRYENEENGVDMEYSVSENEIKENLILKKKPKGSVFRFEWKGEGLIAKLSEDKKEIFFFDSKKEQNPIFSIPPIEMSDAAGFCSEDAHYELSEENGKNILKAVISPDWLFNEERVYPIIIDPRVYAYPTDEGNPWTMVTVKSDGGKIANGARSHRIGYDNCGTENRLYMKIKLPTPPAGYQISDATVKLVQKSFSSNGYPIEFDLCKTTAWSGNVVSWGQQPSLSGDVLDTVVGKYRSNSTAEFLKLNATAAVKEWYQNGDEYGYLVLKVNTQKSEADDHCCDADSIMELYSNYYTNINCPMLYFTYSAADAYADHQKYHTFELGRAGTGSVNLFNGKLSFAHGDVSAEGVKLPLSVSHLYRHEYTNESDNSYGKGWRLSTAQTLEVINQHGIVAVYTNAQGKRHYFVQSGTEVTDDSGLGLKYKEECNCICGKETTHVLWDEKGNKMTFNAEGQLIQLIDAHSNISCLTYSNGKLIGVVDGNHNTASLYYDQNRLQRIEDGSGRSIWYGYDAAGRLTTITYPSSDQAYSNEGTLQSEFAYDSQNRLIKVKDYTGISYAVEYDSNNRVARLVCSGSKRIGDNEVVNTSNEIPEDALLLKYHSLSTAIQNERTNIKTVYKLDAIGRELSSYLDLTEAEDPSVISESTPTEISGYTSITDNEQMPKVGKYRSLSVSMNHAPQDETNLIQNGFFADLNSNSKPIHWTTIGSSYGLSDENYLDGKTSFYLGSNGANQYLEQRVDVCSCSFEKNILVASAWAKANSNPNANTAESNAKFRMVLKILYENGETEEYAENYEPSFDGWQYAAIPFVLKKTRPPKELILRLDYSKNSGVCNFTNVRLVEADGIVTTNTYRTDATPLDAINVFGECKEIKMLTVKEDRVQTTTDYTDDRSDIVRNVITDRSGRKFITDYQYDSKHNLIKTRDYRGLVIEYTYNAYGKELTRKTYHENSPYQYQFSEYTYQEDHFLQSERDPRYLRNGEELKTTYVHDTERNLLLKQTAVNGQEYHYTYDNKTDDLKSLSSATENKNNENQFFYTRGYLTRVAHNGFHFGFSFDELGRSKSVTVGDDTSRTTLLTTTYSKSGDKDLTETVYASEERSKSTTDLFGNPTVITYTGTNGIARTLSTASYDKASKIKQLIDNEAGICYHYVYDTKGNLIRVRETDAASGAALATNTFVFDSGDRMTAKTYGALGHTYRPIYETSAAGYIYPDNEVLGITLDGKFTDRVTKDGLRRAWQKTFSVGNRTLFSESYGYLSTPRNGGTVETEIVSSVTSHVYGTSANSSTLNYTYDKAGNLETVSNGTTLIAKYYYDGLNRLKREDNHAAGKTYTWEYDVGGNILSKKSYSLCTDAHLGTPQETLAYTYRSTGWKDQLISVGGASCSYDSMGNPTLYKGQSLAWTKVRRLASYGANTFSYGTSGIRYRKNNTVYTLDGNKILRESDGTKTLTYYHGGSGIVGFAYNGTDYYFRKNLQGDVTEIYTSAGLKVASYTYDAWGRVLSVNNHTAENIGDLNPIRYRSYYYDVETGLYYLNSRYYDPETGRFINADTTDVLENAKYDINGLNLYAYCDNNPVSGRDDEGDMSFWKKLAIAAAAVVVIAAAAAVVAAATAATGGAAGAALCAVTSTFVGAAKGAAIGAITGAITGAATGAVQGAVEGYQENGWDGVLSGMGRGALKGAVQGAADGLISGMVSGAFAGAMNPSFCFVAGTTVLTTLGKKAIEHIRIGDAIPCVDHITGEESEKRVVTTTVNKVNRLIELEIDGETIQCTETHPFQVKGKGWVEACELIPGDLVYTKGWRTAPIQSVNLLELDEPIEVFNFEVEDCHTYFVGELGVLVHNACGDTYKKLTKSNYRNNSLKYHGSNGNNVAVHHSLPQQYRPQFEARGINIDSPVYTKLLNPTQHAKLHAQGYNQGWGTFFKTNPNATYVDIMKFAGIM